MLWQLAFSCLFPQGASGMSHSAPDGRYNVRLMLNGAMRQVSVAFSPRTAD